jgi:hypothetical protein
MATIETETIKQVLMRRDRLTSIEADLLIEEAKAALQEYLLNNDLEAAEDICAEYFGLEPDYIYELF